MSKLTDQIITPAQVADKRINTMPIHPSEEGWSGTAIQNRFDAVPTTLLALTTLTNIINILSENIDIQNTGAKQIGATGFFSDSSNVQAVLNALIQEVNTINTAIPEKVDKVFKPDADTTLSITYANNGLLVSYNKTVPMISSQLTLLDNKAVLSFNDSVLEVTPDAILLNGREPIFDAPSYLHQYDTFADFPPVGNIDALYYNKQNQSAFVWTGTDYAAIVLPTWINTLDAGIAVSLPPGSQPTVTNSGTEQNAIFDFGIPKGDKGDKGDTGDTGVTGPAGTIDTVSAVGLAAGVAPTVTNTGTPTAAKLQFGIPKGDIGATGPKGDPGSTGTPGAAATIAVGTTTTGAAGTAASVVNAGTSSAARFNFTIPRGATGAKGDPGPSGGPLIAGGAVGQLMMKTSDSVDYSATWVTSPDAQAILAMADVSTAINPTSTSTAPTMLKLTNSVQYGRNMDIDPTTGIITLFKEGLFGVSINCSFLRSSLASITSSLAVSFGLQITALDTVIGNNLDLPVTYPGNSNFVETRYSFVFTTWQDNCQIKLQAYPLTPSFPSGVKSDTAVAIYQIGGVYRV